MSMLPRQWCKHCRKITSHYYVYWGPYGKIKFCCVCKR